jgi:BA14K-like protein
MYSPASRFTFAALVPASLLVQPASAVVWAPPNASVYRPGAVHRIYWLRTLWGPKWEFWRSGPVVGGFIMGGVLVAAAVAQRRASNDAIRNCAEDFPGFDPRTGTFVNESGERRVCPYLY